MDAPAGHRPMLAIEDLAVRFYTLRGVVHALDGVSLEADHGEAVGLVGETGCGKSITARAILRLIDPPGRIVRGRIVFEGRDLLALGPSEIRAIRGGAISMVSQEPKMSLNPVMRVGDQVAETLVVHDRGLTGRPLAPRRWRCSPRSRFPIPGAWPGATLTS